MRLIPGDLYVINVPPGDHLGHLFVKDGDTLRYAHRASQWMFYIVGGKHDGKLVGILRLDWLTPKAESDEGFVYSE